MKKQKNKSTGASALQIALALALISVSAILFASSSTQPTGSGPSASGPQPDRPAPDVVVMRGPVSQDQDLRQLPYIAPGGEEEEHRLTRHPFPLTALHNTAA